MLLRRCTLLAATLVCALLALPAIASAKDYCFGPVPGCPPSTYDDSELDLALAEAESNGTDDRFFLAAPAQFTNGPFSYQSAERVEIVGAGAAKTVLQGAAAAPVLYLGGNPDSSVRNLTIEPLGSAEVGLTLAGTRAQGVAVDATAAPSLLYGVIAGYGASFDDGSVNIGNSTASGVFVSGGAATVTDSRLIAPSGYGLWASGNEATVRRSTFDAAHGAWVSAGRLVVSDTLVRLPSASFTTVGIEVVPGGAAPTAEADLDRLTIVRPTPGKGGTVGVYAAAAGAGRSATVRLRDSVISAIGEPLGRTASNGATASLSTDRSSYVTSMTLDFGAGSRVEAHRVTAAPGFVDAAGGDFHLAAGSPLVDAGTPGGLPAGTADRDGNPRPSDGDGDGTAVSDVGAFERRGTDVNAVGSAAPSATLPPVGPAPAAPSAPVLSRLKVSPTRIAIGTPLPRLLAAPPKRPAGVIGFRLSEPARVELRFAKLGKRGRTTRIRTRVRVKARQGANRVRFAARLNRKLRLRPGAYKLTAIATDSAGARSKPATTRFTAIQPKRR